jgi:DNA-directed RNA polymerase sigma subunit (sigma70/sigma32)
LIGNVEAESVKCVAFCAEEMLSQKKMIRLALNTPMTINELYEMFPFISEQNIAPLVAQLKQEELVFVTGKKLSKLKCGINRHQDIYSSREEHRPKDYSDSIALLNSIFGVGRARAPQIQAEVQQK